MGTERSSLAIEQKKKIESFSHYHASSVSWANLEKTDYLLRLEVTPTSPGQLYTLDYSWCSLPACMCSAYGAEKRNSVNLWFLSTGKHNLLTSKCNHCSWRKLVTDLTVKSEGKMTVCQYKCSSRVLFLGMLKAKLNCVCVCVWF